MRKTPLVEGEYYHIYNRGVDKRTIFENKKDLFRFFQSIEEFNHLEPIGSIFLNSFNKKRKISKKLVEIVCYCLNPNHFHFVLKPLVENGISEFMKRLNGGYTSYFNNRHKRNGVLFQGLFKKEVLPVTVIVGSGLGMFLFDLIDFGFDFRIVSFDLI